MGMSTHCIGLKNDSEEYQKHARVVEACFDAGCERLPEKTANFFGHEDPDPCRLLESLTIESDGWATEWADDCAEGYEVEVSKIPPSVKTIRFYNSW